MDQSEVIAYIRAAIDKDYNGVQKRFADSLDMPPPHITQILNGKRKPPPRVLEAVGLERVVVYREKADVV